MSVVVEVIERYLQQHRRLVVPAFGAFVVKDTGERIFSDLLNSDDGVLVSLLRDMGLNEMEAAVMVDRFIFEVRYELDQYGYCRLGEVGTLRVEPDTKILRLYPPVSGEMPKQIPYIPKPIVDEEPIVEETPKVEEQVAAQQQTPQSEITTSPSKPQQQEPQQESQQPKPQQQEPKSPQPRKPKAKPRKGFDFVVVIAVVIVLAALAAIGYGWYVSHLSEIDDAAMDALRVTPEQTIN